MSYLVARAPHRLVRACGSLAVAAAAVAVGVLLPRAATVLGGRHAALLMLAIAAAPLLVLAIVGHRLAGIVLVLALFPIGSVHVPTPGIALQAVEFAVFLVSALVVLRRLAAGLQPLAWAPPLWWVLALAGWAIVATEWTVAGALSLALKQDAVLVSGVVLAAVILATVRGVDDVRTMLGAFLVVATGIAIAGLVQPVRLQTVSAGQSISGRLQGAFEQPNQMGMFCAVAALVAIGMALGGRSRIARLGAALAVPVILAALLLSLSRGAWIGTAIGFLYLLAVLPQARRALVLVAIPFVVLGALFGSFAPGHTQINIIALRAESITTVKPYDARPAIYAEAIREIKAHPLVGEGPGSFPVASERAASASSTVYADHAHNLWLTWGAEAGLPAVGVIVAFTLSLGFAAARGSRAALAVRERRDRALMGGITAALLVVLGQGIVDYPLRNAVLWVLTWTLIGALVVCAREYGAFSRSDRPAGPSRQAWEPGCT